VGTVEIAVKRVLARYGEAEVRGTRDLLTALADGLDVSDESHLRRDRTR
jgi:hypothetical protein